MKNADLPAHPTLLYNRTSGETNGHELGLTKREIFAMAAMQGILANATTIERGISAVLKGNAKGLASHVAGMAVEYADELLKQLNHE